MIIGSHLLEAVVLEDFEAVDVQDTDDSGSVVVVLAMAPLLLEKKKLDISNSQPNARLDSNSGNHLLRTDFFEKLSTENTERKST